jgi:hypothetical protein
MEVKILLCLHFASFMTHHFTSIATFVMLQAIILLLNNYSNVKQFMFAHPKEVKDNSFYIQHHRTFSIIRMYYYINTAHTCINHGGEETRTILIITVSSDCLWSSKDLFELKHHNNGQCLLNSH